MPEATVSEDFLTGNKTVLLIDDEELIIEIGKAMLQRLGYHVLLAQSGQEATILYQEHQDTIDGVILDMLMPGMNGSETFDALININPEVKVLLSTGFSINEQVQSIIQKGCKGVIQKPFNITTLSQNLRAILD